MLHLLYSFTIFQPFGLLMHFSINLDLTFFSLKIYFYDCIGNQLGYLHNTTLWRDKLYQFQLLWVYLLNNIVIALDYTMLKT